MDWRSRDQVVSDVAAGTAFLEIVGGDGGKSQSIIKLSEGQKSGVGGDGGTMDLQPDLGIELEPERRLFAVTHRVPPTQVRKLSEIANLLHVLYLKYG